MAHFIGDSPDQKTLLHELAQLVEQGDLNAAQKLLSESGYKKPDPSLG